MAPCTIETFDSQTPPPASVQQAGLSVSSAGVQQISTPPLALQAIPDPLWFAPTIDARLKIHEPFCVRISRSGEVVTAVAEEIEEFGYGPNASDALSDLGKTIAELYLSLEGADLSGDLATVRAILERHIRRVHR